MRGWGLLTVAWTACSAVDLPEPIVEHIEPPFAFNGRDTLLTVLGEHFYPGVRLDPNRGGVQLDDGYRVELDNGDATTTLVGVTWRTTEELVGTLPEGVAPGRYDVHVEGPTGVRGTLLDAIEVTDKEAVRLALSVDDFDVPVDETFDVHVTLEDLAGTPIDVPIDVLFSGSVEGVDGVPSYEVIDVPFEAAPQGDGVVFSMANLGTTVRVSPHAPGILDLVASPAAFGVEVLAGEQSVRVVPSDMQRVSLRLADAIDELPIVQAGEALRVEAELVDNQGFAVEGALAVTLQTTCSGWVQEVLLNGPVLVDVRPEVVTDPIACPDNDRVEVLVSTLGLQGQSEPFVVVAGSPAVLNVRLPPDFTSIRAGATLSALVSVQDAFGNDAASEHDIQLEMSNGGLLSSACSRVDASVSLHACTGIPTVAELGVLLRAFTADGGPSGESVPFEVRADEAIASADWVLPTNVLAGELSPFDVIARDEWGNPIGAASLNGLTFAFDDELDEVVCENVGVGLDGTVEADCRLFTARSGATLTVSVDGTVAGPASAPFVVDNGPAAVAHVQLGSMSVLAGEPIDFLVSVEDAWGNPYIVRSTDDVGLSDTTGTWTPPALGLDMNGQAAGQGIVLQAGRTDVTASILGEALGSSDLVTVEPASPASLEIHPGEPWAWVGEPMPVDVIVRDAFGNVSDVDGEVGLASGSTASPSTLLALLAGVGQGSYTWTEASLADDLLITFDGLAAQLTGWLALDDCGESGPVLEVDFDGLASPVACVDPVAEQATFVADLSLAQPGDEPLALFGFAAQTEGADVASSPQLSIATPVLGAQPVRTLVVDAAACAVQQWDTGWTAPDDGTPAGPLELVLSASTMGIVDTLQLDVLGASDCRGQAAAAKPLHARATAGAVLPDAMASPGFEIVLDAVGSGSVELQTAGLLSDGTAAVHVWADGLTAAAQATIGVIGDDRSPIVVGQSPQGGTLDSISVVTIEWSEPMDPATVDATMFSIAGPEPRTVVDAQMGIDNTVVELTFDAELDGALGSWNVVASGLLSDDAANLLAGDWLVPGADYVMAFGGLVVDAPTATLVGVTPDNGVFRPDDGGHPDDPLPSTLSVTVESDEVPWVWVVDIEDDVGERVLHHRIAGTTSSLDWTWDGRDERGFVVPNGVYTFLVGAQDDVGNVGVRAEFVAEVDNVVAP